MEWDVCVADSPQGPVGRTLLPLVTVALPVFNAGKYLRLAVLSIVAQTCQNWELLLIDDGSTDNAFQDISDISDRRIRILRDGRNRGLAARLNEAIDMARGTYFARMDADDVSYPERFERQIAALRNCPDLDLVATRAIMINESDQAMGLFPSAIFHEEICSRPWRGFYFPHPTWMGRIEWFRKHRYTIPPPYLCEDQELLLRSHRCSQFGTIDEILFAYRMKSKVNWHKLTKTRCSVVAVQLRYFSGLNQWHSIFLAIVTFIARLGSDVLSLIGRGALQSSPNIEGDVAAFEWVKVLDGLVTSEKCRETA